VLYCAEQLTEFLNTCERNGQKRDQVKQREAEGKGPRKENCLSSGKDSSSSRARVPSVSKADSRRKDQASLPFAGSR
jgi:hypothetical protein